MGWVAAFVYCSCAALRLARFNTNLTVVDKRYFQGLPSPAAAAVVMGFIWVMDDAGYQQADMQGWLAWTAMAMTLLAGLTMVTNLPFYSFKEFSLKRTVPFIVIVALGPGHRTGQSASADRAVRRLLPVRGIGLWRVRLEAHEGPPGQRDRDIDR